MKQMAINILKEAYLRCNKVFNGGICDAYLYGSYARGDNDEESDVDILMTVDMNYEQLSDYRTYIAEVMSDLSLDNNVFVSIAIKPLQVFRKHLNVLPYYQNIIKEGIRYDA